jgi:hypothetical protein
MSRIVVVLLAVMVGSTLAACSEAPSADVAAFCDSALMVERNFTGETDFDALAAALDAAESGAPSEIEDAVRTVVGVIRSVLETGDFALLESEEFAATDDRLDAYRTRACGYPTVEMAAVDYAFLDVPERLDRGTVAIEFRNDGAEAHEIVVVRIDDETERTVAEILTLSEDEAMSLLIFIGGGFAMPGESDVLFVGLEPGRYELVCTMPVGSTPENLARTEADEASEATETRNETHLSRGMTASFVVVES